MNKNIIGGKFFYDRNFSKRKNKINGSFFYNGRSAFYDLLKKRFKNDKIKTILLPAFTCKSLIEVTKKLKLKTNFYSINKNFEPNLSKGKDGLVVLIDYFGINCLKNHKISNYLNNNHVIIDKSHTFLNDFKHQYNQNIFFSLRKLSFLCGGFHNEFSKVVEKKGVEKFFNQIIAVQKEKAEYVKNINKNRNISYELSLIKKFENLEKKLTLNSYNTKGSKTLINLYEKYNWSSIIKKRKNNFKFLAEELKDKFKIINYNNLKEDKTPIFLVIKLSSSKKRDVIRDKLIKNDIFPPILWPKIKRFNYQKFKYEEELCSTTLCLPIDQRYDIKHMNFTKEIMKKII